MAARWNSSRASSRVETATPSSASTSNSFRHPAGKRLVAWRVALRRRQGVLALAALIAVRGGCSMLLRRALPILR